MTDLEVDNYEESDGFIFTRTTRSKKAKAAAAAIEPAPIPEKIREEEPKEPLPKKARKKSAVQPNIEAIQAEGQPEKRRRSPRNSGASVDTEPPPVQVKKRRIKEKAPSTPAATPQLGPEDQPQEQQKVATEEAPSIQNEEVTKIALPFADTPIIRRNQEMRANSGQRRSSLGNRGRRASSLIDSGKSNGNKHRHAAGTRTERYSFTTRGRRHQRVLQAHRKWASRTATNATALDMVWDSSNGR